MHTSKTKPKSHFPPGTIPDQFMEHHVATTEDDEGIIYFDWQTISARCRSPDPEHPAYGMSISEYIRNRANYIDNDDSGKSQISFRVPPVIGMGLVRMAKKHNITATRYLTYILEHGLITFQKDYCEQTSIISADLDALFYGASDDKMLKVMAQSIKQKIALGSACRDNQLFTPQVQEWMAGSIKSTSLELNCTQSDMAYICILIGIRNDNNEHPLPEPYMKLITDTISEFEFELSMLVLRVQNLLAYDK